MTADDEALALAMQQAWTEGAAEEGQDWGNFEQVADDIDTLVTEGGRGPDGAGLNQEAQDRLKDWISSYMGMGDAEREVNENFLPSDALGYTYKFTTGTAEDGGATKYDFDEHAFDAGVRLFNDGDFREAIAAFEAVVQREEASVRAWMFIGLSHSEIDDDISAVAAYERGLRADPQNLEVVTHLATSLANQRQIDRALATLRAYIEHHPRYGHLHSARAAETLSFELVRELFIGAARLAPAGGQLDPDIQVLLGILHNLSGEYSRAIDCFQASLRARPEDHMLWNKLGATLANSGRHNEATSCYRKALQLKPRYVRTWVNLALSYQALGMPDEATRHFVGALNMDWSPNLLEVDMIASLLNDFVSRAPSSSSPELVADAARFQAVLANGS